MNESGVSRRGFMLSALAGLGAAATAKSAGAAVASTGAREFDTPGDALAEAARLVENEGACRVVVRGAAIASVERGRGAGPLMRLLDAGPDAIRGATLVESVAGRAVAALAIKGGAARVVARTASEGARDILSAAGIPLSAKVVVPHVMNRDLTGPCPVEAATSGIDSPGAIIAAARVKLEELQSAKGAPA